MEGTHLLFLQLVDICSLLNVFGAVNVSNCDWLWSLDQCGLDVVMFCRSCLSSAFECSEFVCKHFNCSYFSLLLGICSIFLFGMALDILFYRFKDRLILCYFLCFICLQFGAQ